MKRRTTLSVLLLASMSTSALSQDPRPAPEPTSRGTEEDAASLQRMLAGYLTERPFQNGLMRVEPDAAGLRIVVAPQELLTSLAGAPILFAPLSFVVSQRPDGDWNVFSESGLNASGAVELEGEAQSLSYAQEGQILKGVFSPALATFRELTNESGSIRSVTAEPTGSSTTAIGRASGEMTGVPAAAGSGVDVTFSQTYHDYTQAFSIKLPEEEAGVETGMPAEFAVAITADAVESRGNASAARTRELLDLYALVLPRVAELDSDADALLKGPFGDHLKQAIHKVLPLWGNVEGTAALRNLNVSGLFGSFRVAEMTQGMRLTGIADDSGFAVDFKLNGIEMQSLFMPPWAQPLVPETIDIGFEVAGVDLATPARIALDEVDFTADPPIREEAQRRIEAAFDPAGIETRITPSRIQADSYDVAFTGDFTFADPTRPEARFAVDAGGFDETIATLQTAAANQPELHQAVGMLQIAKGFGRAREDGRTEWVVEIGAGNSLTVNGTMLKGPDPVEKPGDGSGEDFVAPEAEAPAPAEPVVRPEEAGPKKQ